MESKTQRFYYKGNQAKQLRAFCAVARTGKMVDSEGKVGESEIWGKRAAWVDYSGRLNGKPYGVAISPTARMGSLPVGLRQIEDIQVRWFAGWRGT
mgnify:CR=1 FL=1